MQELTQQLLKEYRTQSQLHENTVTAALLQKALKSEASASFCRIDAVTAADFVLFSPMYFHVLLLGILANTILLSTTIHD